MIGQVFGNYKITQKLGEGGMGEVYRGVDMMLEREVAIKFLLDEAAGSERIYFQLVPVNDHGMLEIIANDLAPKCK